MNLYVVRHGQTWANAEQRYLGALDPELSETGVGQAHELCGRLPVRVDALVSSPLLRARQTADILGIHLGLATCIVDGFRERNVGVFEGLTQQEARQRHPDLWARNITRQWNAAPPGGESIAQVVRRVHRALLELEATWHSRNVVLVAHGFVAKTIRALALGDFSDFFQWQLPNAELLALQSLTLQAHALDVRHDPLSGAEQARP